MEGSPNFPLDPEWWKYIQRMNRSSSGTSGGSLSPPRGIHAPPAASTPQRSPPQMDRTFSPPPSSGELDSTGTFSGTYSGTDHSFSTGSPFASPRAPVEMQTPMLREIGSPLRMDRTLSPPRDKPVRMARSFPPQRRAPRGMGRRSLPRRDMVRPFSPQRSSPPGMGGSLSPQGMPGTPPMINRPFSPQSSSPPRMDGTFSSSGSGSPPGMGGSFSPQGMPGTPPMINRPYSPESGSPSPGTPPMINRPYSPESGSPSPQQRWVPWTEGVRSPAMGRNISDRTFSDRTYSGSDRTQSFTSDEYYEDDPNAGGQYLMVDDSPLYETDESFPDEVFEEGDFPMVLKKMYSPGWGPYRDLVLDRGYYPAMLQAGAENFDPQLFESPPRGRSSTQSDEVVWRRPSPEPHLTPHPYPLHSGEGKFGDEPTTQPMESTRLWSPLGWSPLLPPKAGAAGTVATPSPQPPPRAAAAGTVKLSPHTPLISQFSRHGYTNPDDKILNIPPDMWEDLPPGIQRQVTITSPGRPNPLHLNIQVSPKNISQSRSGEHIICDIAVGVEEAVPKKPPRNLCDNFTPPMTETVRHFDRKHGMFTPRSVFKGNTLAARNLFDVDKASTPSPRPPRLNTSIEWEQDYLRRLYSVGPSGAGLNTTFTRSPGLNRTYDAGPSGAGLNTTFTRSPGLNRTYDAGPSGAGLNTTFTRSQGLNRTYDAGPSGAGLNATFTKSQGLNRTYDAGPSGAGLNATFTRSPGLNKTYDAGSSGAGLNATFTRSPGLNRTYDAGPSGAGMNATFTRSPGLNRTYDAGPSGAGLNATFTRSPSPGLNRTYDAGPSGAGLNATFNRSPSPGLNRTFDAGPSGSDWNTKYFTASSPGGQGWNRTSDSSGGYETDDYQTPSYREPEHPVWTHPMRKRQVAASPAQDLITAVEDMGFDYYSPPRSPSPRRYYPETN